MTTESVNRITSSSYVMVANQHLWRRKSVGQRPLICDPADIPSIQRTARAQRAIVQMFNPSLNEQRTAMKQALNKWFDLVKRELIARGMVWRSGWESLGAVVDMHGQPLASVSPVTGLEDIPGFISWLPTNIFRDFHNGVDFMAYTSSTGNQPEIPLGTPVYSVLPGIVLDVSRAFGKRSAYYDAISIAHGVNADLSKLYISFYCHVDLLSPETVIPGQLVRSGQIISRVTQRPETKLALTAGREGPTPNHLHFELQTRTSFLSSRAAQYGKGPKSICLDKEIDHYDPAPHVAPWALA